MNGDNPIFDPPEALSAIVIQLHPEKGDPECSFCKVLKSKSKRFFSNQQGKFICDKCVIKAKQLIGGTNVSN